MDRAFGRRLNHQIPLERHTDIESAEIADIDAGRDHLNLLCGAEPDIDRPYVFELGRRASKSCTRRVLVPLAVVSHTRRACGDPAR